MDTLKDTIPVSITTRALSHNLSMEEKERREDVVKNKDFYYDKAYKYMEQVTPDVDLNIVNLLKVLVKKRTSLLYSKNLVREFDGPKESVTFLESFYKDINIDKFLLAVDKMSELTGTGLIHIAKDEESEFAIKLQLFDGSEISVLDNYEDPNIADAISLVRVYDKFMEGTASKEFTVERIIEQQIWTKDSVSTYSTGASGGQPLLNNTITHDLKTMPFVPFKGEDVEGQYLGHSMASGWRALNHNYNNLLTHLGFMIKMESATPIVLTGYEKGEGLIIHPGKAISIGAGATATPLNFNPKIMDTLETVKYIEDKIYEASSVPKVTILGGGDASSGRELMIQWFPLLQVFNDKAVRFKRYELQLANTILTLVDLPLLEGIDVNYPESSILPLSAEDDNLKEDIELNLKTAIDELMRRKPDLSEEDAEIEVRANKAFNDDVNKSSQPLEIESDEPIDDGQTKLEVKEPGVKDNGNGSGTQ